MKLLAVLSFAAVAVSAAALNEQLMLKQDPVPQGYAPSFFAIVSDTKINLNNTEEVRIQAVTRWYDYPTLTMRNDCQLDGVTSSVMFVNTTVYIFNKLAEKCMSFESPTTVISPHWPAGENSKYLGTEFVNGVECHKWVKLDHLYYESIQEQGRVVRVFAPFDNNNYSSQQDFAVYQPLKSVDVGVFQVPKYCHSTEQLSEEDQQKYFPCYIVKRG